MILHSHLPKLCERDGATRVLDVGGWHNPFNLATHVLDIEAYETRRRGDALDPDHAERFTAKTWTRLHRPWPFPDGYFDFSVCSHLLEDVRDQVGVLPRTVARS